jgi:Kdo2-lipid IVA lauroyltransferase/acyltransferase
MKLIFTWFSRWPLPLLHALGGVLGWLVFALSPTYRQRFKANVQQAGVPWRVARGAVAQAGRMVAELPYLWLRPSHEPLGERMRFEGAEFVRDAHAQGRGILFLTPHLGSFEVAGQAYAELFGATHPVTVLYRPARKAWLREVVDTTRGRPGLMTAPASLAGVRQMVRALKKGEAVGLLPDQVPPMGMGEWAPFWGREAYTMTLASRLVQQSGAVVMLIWCERLPRGRGYVVRCEPLTDALPSDPSARAQCAAIINRAMERMILRCPQQYLWGYHRYKQPAATLAKE